MQILTVPKDQPLRLAFSPDGRYLAGGGGRAFHLWDLNSGPKPLWSLTKSDLALNFIFAPSGAELRGGSYSEFSRYDVLTGHVEPDLALCEFDPRQFSPDGRFALAVESDRDRQTLRLTCAALKSDECEQLWKKNIRYNREPEPAGYRALLFSVDGGQLIRIAGRDVRDARNMTATGLDAFDAMTGELVAEWTGNLPYYACAGAVGLAGKVALLNGRSLHMIDTAVSESKPMKSMNASPKPLEMAAFSRDGSQLAAVGRDGVVTLWDVATWKVKCRYEWNIGALWSVCFAPDGLLCAAGSETGQVVVWDAD